MKAWYVSEVSDHYRDIKHFIRFDNPELSGAIKKILRTLVKELEAFIIKQM